MAGVTSRWRGCGQPSRPDTRESARLARSAFHAAPARHRALPAVKGGTGIRIRSTVRAAGSEDWRGGIAEVTFRSAASTDDLELEKQWLARTVTQWLDEEWTPLAVHQDLGAAAAEAYGCVRLSGQDEAGSVLLALIPELQAFDYRETFVDAFEVANKVVEMIMLREGRDVCCTSDADKERVQPAPGQL